MTVMPSNETIDINYKTIQQSNYTAVKLSSSQTKQNMSDCIIDEGVTENNNHK